jgi:hypothetical protein
MAEQRTDWVQWHRAYDDPSSRLSARLRVVQEHIVAALDAAPHGRIRIVSMCAGEGRDLLGVLPTHPRRDDVSALLVELDSHLVEVAEQSARDAGLRGVRVVRANAALSDSYDGAVPAHIVMACGVFGNITDDEIRETILHLPHWCAEGATVIWTRAHAEDRDLIGMIQGWFADAGFEEIRTDMPGDATFRVGSQRLTTTPPRFEPGRRLFTFRR